MDQLKVAALKRRGLLRGGDTKEIQKANKIDVEEKENIEFVIPSRYATEALQATEESFYLIPFLVDFLIVLPQFFSVSLRRNNGCDVLLKNKCACFISFVGTIHREMCRRNIGKFCNEVLPIVSVMGIARGKFDH